MKSTASFKRGVAQARKAWGAGRYDRALTTVSRLLELWPDNPQLLGMWGNLVQLQGERGGPTLDEARAALERAAELDEESPEAWKELGHFLSSVKDDARAASRCFDKAVGLCKHILSESLLAKAQSLSELGRREEALACLAEAYWLQSRNG